MFAIPSLCTFSSDQSAAILLDLTAGQNQPQMEICQQHTWSSPNLWNLCNWSFSFLLGFYPSAILLVLTSYTDCDQIHLSVTYMVLATGFLSFNNVGYNLNDLDIAPRYSGVLMGIKNFAGTIPGCIAPSITGYLTNDDVCEYISIIMIIIIWVMQKHKVCKTILDHYKIEERIFYRLKRISIQSWI